MSDDIFNYFSSRGTKKVEPIDDADFDSIDAPPPPEAAANPEAEQKPGTPSITAAVPLVSESESRPPREKAKPAQPAAAAKPAKKEPGHWDYLASLLGIKKSSPTPIEEEELADEEVEPSPAQHESTAPSSSQASIFNLEPAQPEKETHILSSLFRPTEPAGSDFERSTRQVDDLDEEVSDSSDEYLEFEIEELDPRSGEDEFSAERRKRREAFSEDSVSTDRRDRDVPRREPPRSRGHRPREESSRNSGGVEETETRGSRRDPRPARHEERSARTPERTSDRNRERERTRPQSDVSAKFGEGIYDYESRSDEDLAAGEPVTEKRRRRRRRGRGRSKETSAEGVGIPSLPPASNELPFYDPPDEFFDEIGWQPVTSAEGRPSTSDPKDRNVAAYEDPIEDLPSDFRGAVREPGGDRKRRRRGRGSRRSREGEREAVPAIDRGVRDEYQDDLDWQDSRQPSPAEDFDDSEMEYSPRHDRSSSEGSSRGQNSQRGSSSDEKKKKFPTWEEAISGMVESNIKNHTRSGGQGRSGKRGRRR